MEFQFPSMLFFLSFFLFIFTLFLIINKSKASTQNLPPGPWKLPIIGNVYHLLGSSMPHHILDQLSKKYGPIMHLKLGEVNIIVISSPEMAREAMKTHDINFSNRPYKFSTYILSYGFANIGFAPYGDYWRQMRKVCVLELLSAKRVQSFRSIREEEVLKFLRLVSASEGSVINLSRIMYSYMDSVISRAAFGKIRKEQEAFVPYLKDMIQLSGGFSVADLFPSIKLLSMIDGMKAKLERAHHGVDKILETIIDDHKSRKESKKNDDYKSGNCDLVDVLLNLQDEGELEVPLTINNIKATIQDMFIAGSETSSTVIEWAMTEMIKNPKVMEKAQAEVRQVFDKKGYIDETGLEELNYLKMVIKEVLRFHPPVPLLMPRESRDQCEINGYQIPKKSHIIINSWTIGRDPNYWIDADKFYPERFFDNIIDYKGANYEFIPFGAGRRICPGITFGIANVELPLANLLYHFDWKLPNGMKPEDLDANEAFGGVVRRENELNLIPVLFRTLCVV